MKPAAVKLYSKVLNATVWIALDRAAARKLWIDGVRDAIYLPEDIEAMRGIPAEALPAINEAKLKYPGTIVEAWSPEPKEQPPEVEQQLGLQLT